MPRSFRHYPVEHLQAEFSYNPQTGELSRKGFLHSNAVGKVYIEVRDGRPVMQYDSQMFYARSLVYALLFGEHVDPRRVHIKTRDPKNLAASNFELVQYTDKFCPVCKTRYQLTGYPADKVKFTNHVRRCDTCREDKRKQKRRNDVLRSYGMKLDDYEALSQQQGGACLICKDATSSLVVDHCHTGGHVRGLLCGLCNTGLGAFKDNPRHLLEAAKYLIRQQG